VITPTPVIYTKSHQLPAANCGIYAKQIGVIAVAWAGAQRFRAVGAVSWPAPHFPPPPVGPAKLANAPSRDSGGLGAPGQSYKIGVQEYYRPDTGGTFVPLGGAPPVADGRNAALRGRRDVGVAGAFPART
jgi:hypothetical protein